MKAQPFVPHGAAYASCHPPWRWRSNCPPDDERGFQASICESEQVIEGPVAQRLEQGTHNPLVVGSNPTGPTLMLNELFDF